MAWMITYLTGLALTFAGVVWLGVREIAAGRKDAPRGPGEVFRTALTIGVSWPFSVPLFLMAVLWVDVLWPAMVERAKRPQRRAEALAKAQANRYPELAGRQRGMAAQWRQLGEEDLAHAAALTATALEHLGTRHDAYAAACAARLEGSRCVAKA